MLVADQGDKVRVKIQFFDLDGAAGDPTAVVFRARSPRGTVTAYTYGADAQVVRDAAGVYHVDFKLTEGGGRYFLRFEGSGGPVDAAREAEIVVNTSAF